MKSVYVVKVNKVHPAPEKKNFEWVTIDSEGLVVLTKKGLFNEGDPAIYFEPDEEHPKGQVFNVERFGWYKYLVDDTAPGVIDTWMCVHFSDDDSKFLTKEVEIIQKEMKPRQPRLRKFFARRKAR